MIRLDPVGELAARTGIIATRVHYRRLDMAGLDQFEGTGVFYAPVAARDQLIPGDCRRPSSKGR